MYKEAVKMGADAIIDLKIKQITKTYSKPIDLNNSFVIREYMEPDEIVPYDVIAKHPNDYSLSDDIEIIGIKVSGFAIKRL
jgi:hypothetical protein